MRHFEALARGSSEGKPALEAEGEEAQSEEKEPEDGKAEGKRSQAREEPKDGCDAGPGDESRRDELGCEARFIGENEEGGYSEEGDGEESDRAREARGPLAERGLLISA
jgi:hypothetical protein